MSLTIHPCEDRDICKDELQKREQATSISEHQDADEEQDVCTPFCICSCCAAHIRLTSIANIDFTGVLHNTKETIPYLEKQVLSDYSHIWQPPRI